MGFPVSFGSGGSSSCPEMYTSHPVFADFQLMINGKPKDYSLYVHGLNPDLLHINYDKVCAGKL